MTAIAETKPVRSDVGSSTIASTVSSYGQIFRSTALVGGSSAINIALRIIRTKVIAVLLGPSGVGLFGLFSSIADLARTVAELGINQSGVRQIAEASGTNDTQRIAVTVTTLRRVALLFGCTGAILLAILSKPVARLTFGNEHYAGGVLVLSLTVLFGTVSEAQKALIQGMRRIEDFARLGVLGAFLGTVFSIPLVYLFGERGVAYSIVCVAAMGVATSWWFARRVKVSRVPMAYHQISGEASELLKLGIVLMACSLLPMAVAYAIRVIVQHRLGIEAAGFYQAAWALSELYVGFILQAMGMDFYPRLTAVSRDNLQCNRLMNEQAEVGLLLAGPGLLGTLTVAPLVIHLFYSARFGPAVDLLRWNCLGMMLSVAISPMAMIQLAKSKRNIFLWTQLARNTIYAGLAWSGAWLFGLVGTAMAFSAMMVIHCLVSYAVARRLSGFHLSPINRKLGALFISLIIGVFLSWYVLPSSPATVLGVMVTLVTSIYSLKMLCALIPLERMPSLARRIVKFLRLSPTNFSS